MVEEFEELRVMNQNKTKAQAGFSLIEVLIAMGIFAIGFMAITSNVVAGAGSGRMTARADQAIFWGQQITESLAGIPLDAPELETDDAQTIVRDNQKAEITVFDAVDRDGNGRADYKTIGLRVWIKKGDDYVLGMEHYYRRSVRE